MIFIFYIDFNSEVVGHFSQGNVDWDKDKNLIANFIKVKSLILFWVDY